MNEEAKVMELLRKKGHVLPLEIYIDVQGRLTDWFNSGGKASDEYVSKQLAYVDRAIARNGELVR